MSPVNRKRNKILFIKYIFTFFALIIFILTTLFLNTYLKPRNITVNFFEESQENSEIKSYVESLVRNNSFTFWKFVFLREEKIGSQVKKEFPAVSSVKISKRMNMDLNIVISKNQEFFYTCVGEETAFLVRCMVGNTEGEFYKGIDFNDNATSTILEIDVNPKVLYDVKDSKKLLEPDSLSGTRVYTSEDFRVLREILKWVQKNGFLVKRVYVDELKIVDIYTDIYKIKVSLDKGYVDTVKDFEIISKTGDLQKYVNDEKEKINYIDLSFKNKVFYKLKSDNASLTSTSSTSTMAN